MRSLSCPQLCNNRNGTTRQMLRSMGKVGQNRKYIQTGENSASRGGGGPSLEQHMCVVTLCPSKAGNTNLQWEEK